MSQMSPFLGEGQSLEVPLWGQQGLFLPLCLHVCGCLPCSHHLESSWCRHTLCEPSEREPWC